MKHIRLTLVLSMAVLATVALSFAQNAKPKSKGPVAGTWECTAHGGPNGDMTFTLYLDQDNDTVTGSVSSPMGDAELSSGSFKEGALELHINGGDENYLLTAKLSGGQLNGNWSAGDTDKGTWEGKKGAETAAAPK